MARHAATLGRVSRALLAPGSMATDRPLPRRPNYCRKCRLDLSRRNGADVANAAAGRHRSGEDSRQRRLVHLNDDDSARNPSPDLPRMVLDPFGERLHEIPSGTLIGQRLSAARAVEGHSQRQRAGYLNLERAGIAERSQFQRVEIRLQRRRCALLVLTGPVHQPPPGRLQVDMQVDEQGRRPAEQVGARPSARQLGQMRQVGQLADDGPGGLQRLAAGQ